MNLSRNIPRLDNTSNSYTTLTKPQMYSSKSNSKKQHNNLCRSDMFQTNHKRGWRILGYDVCLPQPTNRSLCNRESHHPATSEISPAFWIEAQVPVAPHKGGIVDRLLNSWAFSCLLHCSDNMCHVCLIEGGRDVVQSITF